MSKKSKIIIIFFVFVSIFSIYLFKNFKFEKNNDDINNEFSFEISEKLDVNKLKKFHLPIIIQFGSEGCGPCRIMRPYLKKLNKELKGKVIIKYIDIWKNPSLGNGYYFNSVPTQMFIDSKGNSFKPSKALDDINFEFKKNKLGYDYTIHNGLLTEKEILRILEDMGYNE